MNQAPSESKPDDRAGTGSAYDAHSKEEVSAAQI